LTLDQGEQVWRHELNDKIFSLSLDDLCALVESVVDDDFFSSFADDIALVVKKLEYFLWQFNTGFRF